MRLCELAELSVELSGVEMIHQSPESEIEAEAEAEADKVGGVFIYTRVRYICCMSFDSQLERQRSIDTPGSPIEST